MRHPATPPDPFLPVYERIDEALRQKSRVLMAIDGMCASGKSTLAERIAARYACNVYHMDHFFLTPEQRTQKRLALPGGNVDAERFEAEVLSALLEGRTVRHRRYDCASGEFLWQPQAEPRALEVVEGAYSLHPGLARAYDLAIGLRVSSEAQRARILAREGAAGAAEFAGRWIPLEERYLAETGVWARCSLVVDTTRMF